MVRKPEHRRTSARVSSNSSASILEAKSTPGSVTKRHASCTGRNMCDNPFEDRSGEGKTRFTEEVSDVPVVREENPARRSAGLADTRRPNRWQRR